MSNIICLDTETTGFSEVEDEILQLTIIGCGQSDVNFNEFYNTTKKTSWEDAQAIHGITPGAVSGKLPLSDPSNLQRIQAIIDDHQFLVGYNLAYDVKMLSAAGVRFNNMLMCDVMRQFSDFYGELHPEENSWLSWLKHYKNKKLSFAADYYGYQFKAHDSFEDVKATIHVWEKMQTESGLTPVFVTAAALPKG